MSSSTILAKTDSNSTALTLNEHVFKLPKVPKRKILNEEKYISTISSIIERDYYPDLKKLKRIKNNNIISDSNNTSRLSTSRSNYIPSTPLINPIDHNPNPPEELSDSIEVPKEVGLNKFLSTYTSEDNASFDDLLEKQIYSEREKNAWVYVFISEEYKALKQREEALAITNESRESSEEFTKIRVDHPFQAKNMLMFNPTLEHIESTNEPPLDVFAANARAAQRLKGAKQTIIENTRFPERVSNNNIGISGIGMTPIVTSESFTPNINGYSFVATPSPAPHSLASPLITWGNIIGTPQHIVKEDTVEIDTRGGFNMPNIRDRELVSNKLSNEATNARNKKKLQLTAIRTPLIQNLPGYRPKTPVTMSPAALNLLRRQQSNNSIMNTPIINNNSKFSGGKTPLRMTDNLL